MNIYHGRIQALLKGARAAHLYCADPGAYALLGQVEPMLRELGVAGGFFMEGWAATAHDPRGIAYSREALCAALTGDDMLLVGTQIDFARTRSIVRFCRTKGVRTALVFDHWKNYSQHFTGRQGATLPDRILLPDEYARSALLRAFANHPTLAGRFPEQNAMVFGHPALDASERIIRETTTKEKMAVRRRLGLITEPLAALFLDPVKANDGYGYDVASVLEFAAEWTTKNRPAMTVAVKPHPRQKPPLTTKDLVPFSRRGIQAALADGAFEALAAAADEVWGITSLALVAAHKAGKPVISFQPDRTEAGRAQSNLYLEQCVVS